MPKESKQLLPATKKKKNVNFNAIQNKIEGLHRTPFFTGTPIGSTSSSNAIFFSNGTGGHNLMREKKKKMKCNTKQNWESCFE
jgi:hypothetical protein